MKPILMIAPDSMSEEDVSLVRANGVVVVVSKNLPHPMFIDTSTQTAQDREDARAKS